MGRPRLFVGVSAGNLDSMLNKLTAQKKVRSEDNYSPGGRPNMRPNRATIVYANLIAGFPRPPGRDRRDRGIRLRRIAHYDYWSDSVAGRCCSTARPTCSSSEWASAPHGKSRGVLPRERRSTALTDDPRHRPREAESTGVGGDRRRPEPLRDRQQACRPAVVRGRLRRQAGLRPNVPQLQYETDRHNGRCSAHGDRRCTSPPSLPLSKATWTRSTTCPSRAGPPGLRGRAGPGVRHHQALDRDDARLLRRLRILQHHRARGRIIQSRSADSVLRLVRALTRMEDFRGTITDVGGSTASMYKMTCKDDTTEHACRRLSCVHPGICENLVTDHGPLVQLLRRVRSEEGGARLRRERRALRPRRAQPRVRTRPGPLHRGRSAWRLSTRAPACSRR